MLVILISIAWLFVLTLLVAVCRTAADGDSGYRSVAHSSVGPIGVRVTLSRAPSRLAAPARGPHRRTPLQGRRPAARSRPVAGHGVR
jgi:hypothetical protein